MADRDGFSLEESRKFKGKLDLYAKARRLILQGWHKDPTKLLGAEDCKAGASKDVASLIDSAFQFLQEHGDINFGLVREPGAEVSERQEAPGGLDKKKLLSRLYEILRVVDFQVTTEKMIRKQLEAEFGEAVNDHKSVIRRHVLYVVQNIAEREHLQPLPEEDEEKAAAPKAKGKGSAQAPHVVVVGAGLAGLAAANVLQRNGAKVTVLEALPHVGGRLAAAGSDDKGQGFGLASLSVLVPPGGNTPSGVVSLQTLCAQLGEELQPTVPADGVQQVTLFSSDGDSGCRKAQLEQQQAAESLLLEVIVQARSLLADAGDGAQGAWPTLTALLDAALVELQKGGGGAGSPKPAKRAPEGDAADDGDADRAASRPAKRNRTALVISDDDDDMGSSGGKPAAGDGAPVAAGSGEAGGSNKQGGAAAEAGQHSVNGDDGQAQGLAALGHVIPADVLELLRTHYLPLLELHLGAPLAEVSPQQLLLIPDVLPGVSKPLHSSPGAAPSTLRLPCSAQRLCEALAKGLTVKLGCAVKFIAYTSDGVKVATTTSESFEASAAVLAVPLGVLRSSDIALMPPLPPFKADTLARLGIGCQVSLQLELPGASQAESALGLTSRGAAAVLAATEVQHGMVVCRHGDNSGSLMAHIATQHVGKALSQSSSDLQQDVVSALRRMAGAAGSTAEIPKPSSCRVVRWSGSVERLRGGCSHLGTRATPHDLQLAAVPLKGRLFFAGEHTTAAHSSGLLAALLSSGTREAARVLKLLRGESPEVGDEPPMDIAALMKKPKEGSVPPAARKDKDKPKEKEKEGGKKKSKSEDADVSEEDLEDELEDSDVEQEEGSDEGDDEEEERPAAKKRRKEKEGGGSKAPPRSRKEKGGAPKRERERDEEGGGGASDKAEKRKGGDKERRKKRGSDSGSEGEDPRERERDKLFSRPPPDPSRAMAERKDAKVLYKAVMDANAGNIKLLRGHLFSCVGMDAKDQMLRSIMSVSVAVMAQLAQDGEVLQLLLEWLEEFAGDGSADHLVCSLLRLLERLPVVAYMEQLRVIGLPQAIQGRCGLGHRSKEVKRQAQQVLTTWERPTRRPAGGAGPSNPPSTGPQPGSGPSAASQRPAAPRFDPMAAVSIKPRQSMQAPAAPAAPKATPPPPPITPPRGMTPPPGTAEAAPASAEPAAVTSLDPALQQRLQQAQAQAEAARQEAMLAAARRAEVQQEAQAAGAPELTISTFDEFKLEERRASGKDREERHAKRHGEGSSGRSSRGEGPSGSGSHHHGHGHHGSGSGGQQGGDRAALEAEVVRYVGKLLHEDYKAGKITKPQQKIIVDKVTRKVMESASARSSKHGSELLSSDRKVKIRRLVDHYRKMFAVGDAAKAASAGGSAGGAGGGVPPPPMPPGMGMGSGMGMGMGMLGGGDVPPPPPPPMSQVPPPPPPQ